MKRIERFEEPGITRAKHGPPLARPTCRDGAERARRLLRQLGQGTRPQGAQPDRLGALRPAGAAWGGGHERQAAQDAVTWREQQVADPPAGGEPQLPGESRQRLARRGGAQLTLGVAPVVADAQLTRQRGARERASDQRLAQPMQCVGSQRSQSNSHSSLCAERFYLCQLPASVSSCASLPSQPHVLSILIGLRCPSLHTSIEDLATGEPLAELSNTPYVVRVAMRANELANAYQAPCDFV